MRAGIPVSILAADGRTDFSLSVAGTVTLRPRRSWHCRSYLMNPDCVLFYGSEHSLQIVKNSRASSACRDRHLILAVQLAKPLRSCRRLWSFPAQAVQWTNRRATKKMINAMLPGRGFNLIHRFRKHLSVMCLFLSQLVLDNEIIAMIRKAEKPFQSRRKNSALSSSST